jgi:hypothetical protein
VKLTHTGTPVPKRDVEERSRGSGPVITYRLSPEELERVRRGERLETRKEEATMSTATAPNKLDVLRRLAAGWKISRIEEELGLSKGALRYWLDKWGLKGVKGEQAQQMLDELIDQRAEYRAVTAVADSKQSADSPSIAGQIVQGLKTHELIERLRRELAEKTARITELEAERKQNREKIEQLREERDALLQTVERAIGEGSRREVSSIEAIEAATVGLSGGLAYHTGAAIEQLWRWQTVEDLRRARHHIDRLVDSVVLEGAAG